MDVLTPAQRRLNMSRIRGRDTGPEMQLRRGLHALGVRFRLHGRELPGRPDLVFPRYHAVIFVNGCFWHGHDCHLSVVPSTRRDFWSNKIEGTRLRDERANRALEDAGWRVLTVWECSLRGRYKRPESEVIQACRDFLEEGNTFRDEIRGTARRATERRK
jgi:DNA mismatch endonuclease, patch repair protein